LNRLALYLFDLFGKPVSTFPDHALGARWAADRLRAHGFSPVK
jgi:hypothetical protein